MTDTSRVDLAGGLSAVHLAGRGIWRVYSKDGAVITDVPTQLKPALDAVAAAFDRGLDIGASIATRNLRDQLCELIGAVRNDC